MNIHREEQLVRQTHIKRDKTTQM